MLLYEGKEGKKNDDNSFKMNIETIFEMKKKKKFVSSYKFSVIRYFFLEEPIGYVMINV